MLRISLALAISVLLSGASFAQDAGDPAKGEKAFGKCKACHDIGESAKNKVGPILNGIVGRAAGSIADYKYSDALAAKASGGLVWDEANIFAYLEDPSKFLDGKSKMVFKLKKEDERHNVIAYLKQFGADGKKM